MSSTQDPLAPLLMVPRILWLALMVSNLMVFGVVSQVAAPPSAPFDPLFFYVFVAVSVGAGVAHVVIPAQLRKRQLEGAKLDTTEQADPNGSVIFRDAAPMVRVFADPAKAARAAAAAFQTPFILAMALAESIGLYGTVLAVLGCPLEQAVTFPLVAALLMARLFPTRQRVIGPFEAHFGARLAA
jgi:hypothetical protein